MKIGIIGLGNLGRSLCSGLVRSGVSPDDIIAYNRTASVCEAVHEKFGIDASGDLCRTVASSDVVFLVVKGYVYEELSERIPSEAYSGKTVISFMAGVAPERLEVLCPGAEIVVAMPTVSIADCTGIVAYTRAPAPVAKLLQGLGYSFETSYDGVVKAAAYAACGLGFAAYLLGAYEDAGRSLGFSADDCSKITGMLFSTALKRGDFGKIVSEVATKGGATERGVCHMDETGVPQAVADAVRLAYEKMA